MNKIRFRPRFELIVNSTPEQVLNTINSKLSKPETKINGKIIPGFITLKIPEDKQHFWSPELSLQIEDHKDGALIRGLFGPRPTVWTMFATFKALMIFSAIISLVYAFVEVSLGQKPYGLLIFIISVILFLIAFALALIGQKLGSDQMDELRSFLYNSLNVD